MTTVAALLAHQLLHAGITTVFGLPGGENVYVMDALRQAGLRFVLVRNESSALFMADAMARITGKPGVCVTTLGPGALNAVAGVGHAFLDRAPILIITAETPEQLLAYHTHQVIDLGAVFQPITKESFQLRADNVAAIAPYAIALTQAGRPGPVHLRVSNEEANLDSPYPALAGLPDLNATAVAGDERSTAGREENLAAARALLARAQRPLIVVGVGLEPERPYAALRELAESAAAPVIVTPKAKGALPDDHPLAAGVIGLTRSDPAYELLDEADAIIAVGFDVVELVKPWRQPQPLVWLAPWPNLDPTLAAVAELVSPLAANLRQLADSATDAEPSWGATRVAQLHQALAARPLPAPAPGRLRPQQVLQILRQLAPREMLVATDVGSHKILAGLTWPALTPNRYLLSNGLSCMGYAVPAAIAASLALDRQPTVALTGDAGMAMVLGELAVMQELQTPVIVVVFNDAALDLIRSAQVRAQRPVFGTEFSNPDFMQIAAAYGIAGERVHDEAGCTAAVERALAAGQPYLIEAMIDPVSYPTTPSEGRMGEPGALSLLNQ